MVMASQHLAAFLETIASERGVADNTLSAYTRDLEDFLGFLREQRCELTMVTSADITTYLRELGAAGLGAASRARRLSAVRQFMKFLVAENVIDENPAFAVSGPKRDKALPKTLSVSEVDRLIETSEALVQNSTGGDRLRAI